MKIMFTVPGEPKGKGRPKFSMRCGRVNARTPDPTVIYENLIRTEYIRQCGAQKFQNDDMLKLEINAYFQIPKGASKERKAAMESCEIRPTKKPDADNIMKVVADSLNCIAYHDDAQIVDARIYKYYSRNPRIEVSIQKQTG
jgi:Holliday junction resolvase RusA-like endonuclease